MNSEYAVLAGLDWADQKHDLCWRETDTGRTHRGVIEQRPERINEWISGWIARYPGRRIAVLTGAGDRAFTAGLDLKELGADASAMGDATGETAEVNPCLAVEQCGKPVVATRLGTGVEFANLDGETGLNVPPRDATALAEAINHLLAHPEERQRMGAFARKRVLENFQSETVARREFELYVAAHEHSQG